MNDTGFMCGFQRFGNLLGYREGFIKRNGTLSNAVGERRPLHQLQHQRTRALRFLDAVDSCNAGMVEAGEDLRLALEPSQPTRISRKRLGQDLQRHLPVQLGISGLIDLAHAALANEGGDVIVAESGADVQGHELWLVRSRAFYAHGAGGGTRCTEIPLAREPTHSDGLQRPRRQSGSSRLARRPQGAYERFGPCNVLH